MRCQWQQIGVVCERTTSRLDEDSLAHFVLDKSRGCVDVICKEMLAICFGLRVSALFSAGKGRGYGMWKPCSSVIYACSLAS